LCVCVCVCAVKAFLAQAKEDFTKKWDETAQVGLYIQQTSANGLMDGRSPASATHLYRQPLKAGTRFSDHKGMQG